MPPTETTTELVELADASGVSAALEAAQAHAQVLDANDEQNVYVVATRDDRRIHEIDLERYEDAPVRSRGTVRTFTAEGFLTSFRQLVGGERPATVYADPDQCRLVAVLNDDEAGNPGWRDHRIELDLKTTPEWSLWTGRQGLGPQARFAEVIEEGETEIVEPSATVMLEIAQTFHASTGAKFKQHGRLRDGRTQLSYEEEIEATAGEGLVDIPESFTIEVRPFYGADPVAVQCRLRYRLERGALTIGYQIHRPDDVRRTSFATDVVDHIREQLKGFVVVEGTPAEALRPGR